MHPAEPLATRQQPSTYLRVRRARATASEQVDVGVSAARFSLVSPAATRCSPSPPATRPTGGAQDARGAREASRWAPLPHQPACTGPAPVRTRDVPISELPHSARGDLPDDALGAVGHATVVADPGDTGPLRQHAAVGRTTSAPSASASAIEPVLLGVAARAGGLGAGVGAARGGRAGPGERQRRREGWRSGCIRRTRAGEDTAGGATLHRHTQRRRRSIQLVRSSARRCEETTRRMPMECSCRGRPWRLLQAFANVPYERSCYEQARSPPHLSCCGALRPTTQNPILTANRVGDGGCRGRSTRRSQCVVRGSPAAAKPVGRERQRRQRRQRRQHRRRCCKTTSFQHRLRGGQQNGRCRWTRPRWWWSRHLAAERAVVWQRRRRRPGRLSAQARPV